MITTSSSQSIFSGSEADLGASIKSVSLDIVMYVASLGSNPRDFDDSLNKIRLLTAKLKPGQELTPQNHAQLASIYGELEAYLTTKERLRTFTKDSLRQRISARFGLGSHSLEDYWQEVSRLAGASKAAPSLEGAEAASAKTGLRNWAVGLAVGSLAVAVLSVVIFPPLATPDEPYSNLVANLIYITACGSYVGAAVLFLTALGGFKRQVKIAYALLCAGFAIFGLGQIQLPLITYLNLWDTIYAKSGGFQIPFMVAILLIYLGARLYAKLLKVKNLATSLWVGLLVAAASGYLITLAPHLSLSNVAGGNETALDIANGLSLFCNTFLIFAAVILLYVRRQIGVIYKPAVNRLLWSVSLTATVFPFYVVAQLLGNSGLWLLAYGVVAIAMLPAGLLLLGSAVAFARIGRA